MIISYDTADSDPEDESRFLSSSPQRVFSMLPLTLPLPRAAAPPSVLNGAAPEQRLVSTLTRPHLCPVEGGHWGWGLLSCCLLTLFTVLLFIDAGP